MAISAAAAALAPDAAANASSRTRLSDNYDTFLVLLTAQLQNQDPLAPMDSTQFTQQLVQFSQVEQQIRTNEQLGTLVNQYSAASAGTAISYLGRDAMIESDTTTLVNGAANWGYTLAGRAEAVTLTVKNARGATVFETTGDPGQGSHIFNWNGRDAQGNPAPAGSYKLVVSGQDGDGKNVTPTYTVRETIRGVDFSGTTPLVITSSGTRDLSLIRAVLEGD